MTEAMAKTSGHLDGQSFLKKVQQFHLTTSAKIFLPGKESPITQTAVKTVLQTLFTDLCTIL